MSRKTTKAEYERFKRTFKQWQLVLGVPEYEVYFELCDTEGACASCTPNPEGCTCQVKVSKVTPMGEEPGEWAEDTARHEALHLFFAEYRHLAESRFCDENEIAREEERIVRILEKLL